jgi:hypothetical protein
MNKTILVIFITLITATHLFAQNGGAIHGSSRTKTARRWRARA